MSDPLLSVESIYAGYDANQVLQNLSIEIEAGSVVSLVGRNGVGKTTTLRSIMGSVQPSKGSIRFRGEEVGSLSAAATAAKGIAIVPESRRIFPGLTVRENIEVGAMGQRAGGDGPSVDEVLSMFENLQRTEHQYGSSLSGGEQQMLAIARGLVADPDLLLLDEPTEGLAPMIIRQVEDKIRSLNDQGVTILLVEQNVEVAMNVADRQYVIDNGQVVHEATTDALAENEAIIDRYLGVSELA